MVRQGVLARYARGRYGLPGPIAPERFVQCLDRSAYITGAYALSSAQLITQVPMTVTCFTDRRHGRVRVRDTAAGRLEFVCVKHPVYRPPEDVVAPAEQALLDFVFVTRRRGVEATALVTFRGLDRLRLDELDRLGGDYPASVCGEVRAIVGESPSTHSHPGAPRCRADSPRHND
jgi:hypothetical protein